MSIGSQIGRTALLIAIVIASAGTASGRPPLRFGITASAAPWSEPATAQAAARPLLDLIAADARLTVSLEAGLGRAQLLAKLRSGELNAGFASAEDYLALAKQIKIVPVLRGLSLGSSSSRLILLVDATAAITSPRQLVGKTISLYGRDSVQRLYLETLLARGKVQGVTVREKKDSQSAVLDVLFREASGCVVPDRLFDTMAELNPQLRKKLAVLARSEPFANPPLFLHENAGAEVIAAVVRHGVRIHTRERGRQLMLMFRISQLVRTRAEDYQSLRDLIGEHGRLVKPGAVP